MILHRLSSVEKMFSQTLIKNVAGEAWDHAEYLRASRWIKSDLISSKTDRYGASYDHFTEEA